MKREIAAEGSSQPAGMAAHTPMMRQYLAI